MEWIAKPTNTHAENLKNACRDSSSICRIPVTIPAELSRWTWTKAGLAWGIARAKWFALLLLQVLCCAKPKKSMHGSVLDNNNHSDAVRLNIAGTKSACQ